MCFNGAKSWQLGWYSSKHAELLNFNTPGKSWSGQLVGIADYGNNLSKNVLIKQVGGWKYSPLLHQLQLPDRYQQWDSKSRNQDLITSK
jgi:hypothetical protein